MVNQKEYPLYPKLTEQGEKEAQQIIDSFKEKISKVAEETIQELYCDVALYIESDSWSNFRNEIMDGFKNYDNRKIQSEYDFKKIRQAILKNHKEDIIKDLDKDLLLEIKNLKETIEFLQKNR